MQKRYKSDAEFILKGDKSLGAVREWAENLFHQKSVADFKLPKEAFGWYLEVFRKAYEKAESDLIKKMMLMKVIHTREVVRAGYDIVRMEKEFEWNDYQVGMVCLLHDVGRFEQALLGSYSDEKSGFDHALEGAEMIRKHSFGDLGRFGIDIPGVIESVKNHSAYQYVGSNQYAKLTRDADKLALLRAMPEILESDIGGFAKKGVTEEAINAYKRGEMVRHKDMKTVADLFLAWLAWEYDFNFSETKRCFEDEGIKEWMMGELKLRGVEV